MGKYGVKYINTLICLFLSDLTEQMSLSPHLKKEGDPVSATFPVLLI
jgi:hypothetical protein